MTTSSDPFSASATHFALRLLQRTVKQSRGGNVLLSPIGVFQAVSVFAFLSPLPIRREIRKELRLSMFGETDPDLFHRYCALVPRLVAPDGSLDLRVATSFWIGARVPPNRDLDALARAWCVDVFTGDQVTEDNMEGWSAERIPGVLSAVLPLPSPDGAVATNAVNMHPVCQTPFLSGNTTERLFQQPDGSSQPKPLMRQPETAGTQTFRCPRFDAARIPLANRGGGRSLHIILPRRPAGAAVGSGSHLTPFVEQFTTTEWEQCRAGYRPARLDLMLPRVALEQHYDLQKTLVTLGFERAFDGAGRVAPAAPALDHSIVQIALKLEESDEAAQPTAPKPTVPSPSGYRPPQPLVEPFHVDRPFVFLLTDDAHNLILAAGVIQTP